MHIRSVRRLIWTEALDDDALFANEDYEEESAFVCTVCILPQHLSESDAKLTKWFVSRGQFTDEVFWVYASLALLPDSAFPLYRFPNVSSRARGTPRAQTQRTGIIPRHHLFLTHAFI